MTKVPQRSWLVILTLPLAACVYDLDKLRGAKVTADSAAEMSAPAPDGPDPEADASTEVDAPAPPVDAGPDGPVVTDAIPAPPEVFPDSPNPTSVSPSAVGRADLVAYYPLDEQTGAYAYDASGNGNHCAVFGPAPRWRTFGFTRAAFPNSGCFQAELREYLECALNTFPAIDDNKTISFWVRYDYEPVDELDMALVVMLNRPLSAALRLEIRDRRLGATNHGYMPIVTADAPGLGAWHHVVYTFDGNNHSLYVDNGPPVVTPIASAPEFPPAPVTAPDARFRMGKSSSGVNDGLRGYLDDVRVYKRALTPTEIAALWGGAP